jgi:phage baseplate assembly protein W
MIGMDARTGKSLEGDAHLAQSVGKILGTPLGSCVARREFGSLLADLVDQPANPASRLRIYAATALAIQRWEPRISLARVSLERAGDGAFNVILDGKRTDTAHPNLRTRLTVPLTSLSGLTVYA